jgi:hypothetical protein
MATTTYTYYKEDFTSSFPGPYSSPANPRRLRSEIVDAGITELFYIIARNKVDIVFKNALSTGDKTTLDTVVANHDGSFLPPRPKVVRLGSEIRDISGKIRVHQSPRKEGLYICWSGAGDDPADVHSIWGGRATNIVHRIGNPAIRTKYIEVNCVNNETWLQEGYLTWEGGSLDRFTFEIVPRVTATSAGVDTNYNLQDGYLIIPADGDGTLNVDADLTDPNAGLVFMPDGDKGQSPYAFWDADYNSTTKLYENITPNSAGEGRYNMFSQEVVLARFVNEIQIHGSGFMALDSSDTEQLGHGMRLKVIGRTNTTLIGDHDWSVTFILCFHRKQTVSGGIVFNGLLSQNRSDPLRRFFSP